MTGSGDSDGRDVKIYYRLTRRYPNRITRFQFKLAKSNQSSIVTAEFDCKTEEYRTIQKTVLLPNGEKRIYNKPERWETISSLEDFRTPLFREVCGKPLTSSK
jgi:hypothetical protein